MVHAGQLPRLDVDKVRVVGSGRGRGATGFGGFVQSIRHDGFPDGHPVRATNDELGLYGCIEHDGYWITGLVVVLWLVVTCLQAGPDATDLWGS